MNTKDFIIISVITLVIFTATYAVLSIFGFVPKQFQVTESIVESGDDEIRSIDDQTDENHTLFPDRITIDKIGVDSIIQKPQSQDVSVLDEALSKGAVYYPGSGTLAYGNMFIFGHSTNWQVVNNQAYKTFNGLEELKIGDEIKVEADGKTYIYKVEKVELVDENAAFVSFEDSEKKLTISTCNTFGRKQDRWVVEAMFDRAI